jgi:hypothetical protein
VIAVALSPNARRWIRSHRDARGPTAEDRERVTAALRAQLGVAVLPLETPIHGRLLSAGIQRRLAAAFGLCVAGAVLFLARKPRSSQDSTAQTPGSSVQATPSANAPSAPYPANPSLDGLAARDPKVVPIAARHPRPQAPLAATVEDTLAQELALLTNAASQLGARQAGAALLLLDDHQRRFPQGVLSGERDLAKARALCMLHRFEEGRAALALLESGTPAAARVKDECDSAWARAHAARSSHQTGRN